MYSKELRTTCRNLQRHTEHMIILRPLPNSGKFLTWQRAAIDLHSPYRIKTRTSLQYHYSWNTCENDLAVPVGPAKTYESPLHKGQNLIACKNPRHKGQNQIACKKSLLSCDRLTVWTRCRSVSYTLDTEILIYHIEVDSVLFVVRILVCTARNIVQPTTYRTYDNS